jgi:hypothetical protein
MVVANLVFVLPAILAVRTSCSMDLRPSMKRPTRQVVESYEVIVDALTDVLVQLRLQLAMVQPVVHPNAMDCYDSDLPDDWNLAIVVDAKMHHPLMGAPKVTFD